MSSHRSLAATAIAILCFILLDSTAQATMDRVEVVGVAYSSSIPYEGAADVVIVVRCPPNCIARAVVYYAIVRNQSDFLTAGWRIAEASLERRLFHERIIQFKARIPDPAYPDKMGYFDRIRFYVEVVCDEGNASLTCRECDRWNPYVEDDKFQIIATDPYPPSIKDFTWRPENPNSEDSVKVSTTVDDGLGAGVSSVELTYSVDGSVPITSSMALSNSNEYDAVIPPQREGTKVTFQVVAKDKIGNKQKSRFISFTVLASPSEIRQKQLATFLRQLQTGLVLLALATAFLLVGGWSFSRWQRRMGLKKGLARPNMRGTGSIATFALNLLLIALLCLELSKYSLLSAASVVAGVLLLWGAADPRADVFLPFRMPRTLVEKPPLAMAASSYITLALGSLGMATKYLLTSLFSENTVFQALRTDTMLAMAVIMKYSMLLLGTSIVLQLLWPYLQSIDVSLKISVEERRLD